jgi:hypothetical protein
VIAKNAAQKLEDAADPQTVQFLSIEEWRPALNWKNRTS